MESFKVITVLAMLVACVLAVQSASIDAPFAAAPRSVSPQQAINPQQVAASQQQLEPHNRQKKFVSLISTYAAVPATYTAFPTISSYPSFYSAFSPSFYPTFNPFFGF